MPSYVGILGNEIALHSGGSKVECFRLTVRKVGGLVRQYGRSDRIKTLIGN